MVVMPTFTSSTQEAEPGDLYEKPISKTNKQANKSKQQQQEKETKEKRGEEIILKVESVWPKFR